MSLQSIIGPLRGRVLQMAVDAAICLVAFWSAYMLRFDGEIPGTFLDQFVRLAPALVLLRLTMNIVVGVYRVVWRYVGVAEVLLFVRSVGIVSAILLALRVALPDTVQGLKVPISVIVLEGTLTFLGVNAARFLRRILHEHKRKSDRAEHDREPALLIGAGTSGLSLARELSLQPELGLRPVGFLDDDASKVGMLVARLRVHGTLEDAESVLKRTRATRLVITTDKLDANQTLALMDVARRQGASVRTVPRLFELLSARGHEKRFREVRIEDLLVRDPIPPSMSPEDLQTAYRGKRVMVTGAGGSIGSELCRQLANLAPKKILLVERDENALFEIHRELVEDRIADICAPVLCDVASPRELEAVFQKYQPEVIFHAAAFKHVPVMERFPRAAVANNVRATRTLAELADKYGVQTFVMISTDKAVKPSSVMGATKRLAEMIVQHIGASSSTRFSCVRFGNVLGSRGSVVPIFRRQIEAGGEVTVTHPEATRYFMTIPEASNLVLQAATQGTAGEIFLLDMGAPVKILDLARKMIHLMGRTEEECPIRIVGTRPGEKLFEELRTDAEEVEPTSLRKIFRVHPERFEWSSVDAILERLDFALRAGDDAGVRAALSDLGIGYHRPEPQRSASGSHPVV